MSLLFLYVGNQKITLFCEVFLFYLKLFCNSNHVLPKLMLIIWNCINGNININGLIKLDILIG